MRTLALVVLGLMVVGCELVIPSTPSPRTLERFDITFRPQEAPPGVVSAEAAIADIRRGGTGIVRPPDVVQFGIASCDTPRDCFANELTGSRAVWLIEWTESSGSPWGLFLIDAATGDTLLGHGGP